MNLKCIAFVRLREFLGVIYSTMLDKMDIWSMTQRPLAKFNGKKKKRNIALEVIFDETLNNDKIIHTSNKFVGLRTAQKKTCPLYEVGTC